MQTFCSEVCIYIKIAEKIAEITGTGSMNSVIISGMTLVLLWLEELVQNDLCIVGNASEHSDIKFTPWEMLPSNRT